MAAFESFTVSETWTRKRATENMTCSFPFAAHRDNTGGSLFVALDQAIIMLEHGGAVIMRDEEAEDSSMSEEESDEDPSAMIDITLTTPDTDGNVTWHLRRHLTDFKSQYDFYIALNTSLTCSTHPSKQQLSQRVTFDYCNEEMGILVSCAGDNYRLTMVAMDEFTQNAIEYSRLSQRSDSPRWKSLTKSGITLRKGRAVLYLRLSGLPETPRPFKTVRMAADLNLHELPPITSSIPGKKGEAQTGMHGAFIFNVLGLLHDNSIGAGAGPHLGVVPTHEAVYQNEVPVYKRLVFSSPSQFRVQLLDLPLNVSAVNFTLHFVRDPKLQVWHHQFSSTQLWGRPSTSSLERMPSAIPTTRNHCSQPRSIPQSTARGYAGQRYSPYIYTRIW